MNLSKKASLEMSDVVIKSAKTLNNVFKNWCLDNGLFNSSGKSRLEVLLRDKEDIFGRAFLVFSDKSCKTPIALLVFEVPLRMSFIPADHSCVVPVTSYKLPAKQYFWQYLMCGEISVFIKEEYRKGNILKSLLKFFEDDWLKTFVPFCETIVVPTIPVMAVNGIPLTLAQSGLEYALAISDPKKSVRQDQELYKISETMNEVIIKDNPSLIGNKNFFPLFKTKVYGFLPHLY